MITKEQALEFLYELSQKTEVMLDVSCGEIQFNRVSSDEYLYTTFSELPTFESAITKCIKENMEAIESMGFVYIPVDIGMLEIGQKYEITTQVDWDHKIFTDTFIGFDEEDDYMLKFENLERCTKYDIEQIYKVTE